MTTGWQHMHGGCPEACVYSHGVTGCGVEESEEALAEDDVHSRVMGHDN